MPASPSLLLIHGAGSGPWVFDLWLDVFEDVSVVAVDLLEGLSPNAASMTDYRDRVLDESRGIDGPTFLCGWSMGGLVALMAAQEMTLSGLILLEPSPPAEVQGSDGNVEPDSGTFDPEVVYGRFPEGVRARPESSLARAERKRGISVPEVSCPVLIISGDEFGSDRGGAVASLFLAKHVNFPGLDHWDLVRHPDVRAAVAAFLATTR